MSGALMWRVGPVPSMPRALATPAPHARTPGAHAPPGTEWVRGWSREILIFLGCSFAQCECSQHAGRTRRTAGLARRSADHVTLDIFTSGQLRDPSTEGNRTVTAVGRVVVFTTPSVIAFTWAENDWLPVTGASGHSSIRQARPRRAANCLLNTEASSPRPPTASSRSRKRTPTADV